MSENKIAYNSERHIIEPGGFYFGDDKNDIYTLLGSCVGVTLWHPIRNVVGMCHVILPERGKEESSTRFANCAIKRILEKVDEFNTVPVDYEVGIYGGGNMFPLVNIEEENLIGVKNFKEVERLLLATGFIIKFKDVGGEMARKININRITGAVSLEHV